MIRNIMGYASQKNTRKVALCSRENFELLDSVGSLEDWFERDVQKIKLGEKIQTGLALLPDGNRVFVKRYQARSIEQITAFLLSRRQKAEHCYNISRRLIASGIPVPEPLAVITDKSGLRLSSYYICQALSEFATLRTICRQRSEKKLYLLDLLTHISKLTAMMHKSGIVHGDLKWPNIMVHPGRSMNVRFIDLDNARPVKFPDNKLYALDLARFAVDMAENLPDPGQFSAFIEAYSQNTGIEVRQLINTMRPYFHKISKKHKKKYGRCITSLDALTVI